MRTCPVCLSEINSDASTCPVCGLLLNNAEKSKTKWYFSNFFVVVAILSFGPLALPLVWFHPHYKRATKIIVSVIVVVLTAWCLMLMKDLYLRLVEQAKMLGIY